jgi:hypothetical protein
MTQHFDPTKLVLVEAPNSTRPEMPEHYDRAKIDELLAAGGILFGNERRLVHQVVWHGKPVGDVVTLEITSEALAEIMSSSTRAIRKWRKAVEQVPGITVETGAFGYRWCINLTVFDPGTYPERTRNIPGTQAEPDRNAPGTEGVGTIGATCEQASPEQETPTEFLAVAEAEREQTHEGEAAASIDEIVEDSLVSHIQSSLEKAGYRPASILTLDLACQRIRATSLSEQDERDFVIETIAKIKAKKLPQSVVENALTNDLKRWQAAKATRESLGLPNNLNPSRKPSNALPEDPEAAAKFDRMIEEGTRNASNQVTTHEEFAAKRREELIDKVWKSAVNDGALPEGLTREEAKAAIIEEGWV